VLTGSLVDTARGPLQKASAAMHAPDEWFVLEVIARGNHLQIKVNGNTTADLQDAEARYRSGYIALETWGLPKAFPTKVHFRKIEIKELPP
jgi:hypothetical protein